MKNTPTKGVIYANYKASSTGTTYTDIEPMQTDTQTPTLETLLRRWAELLQVGIATYEDEAPAEYYGPAGVC